jgi:ABC-2 type transport system ATP-binding protein
MSVSPAAALAAEDLVKIYPGARGRPDVRALDGLSLHVPAGTVFALLGPNGAGKSTAVKILSTLARPDSGTAVVAGYHVGSSPELVRAAIGLVGQRSSGDPMGTGRENLVLAARLNGLSRDHARARAGELLTRFELTDAADRLVKTYSGGMSRRLDIAIGLVARPQVLFLDEPTTGLDPEARTRMWSEIAALTALEQVTVLLTTHYLDEADHLADRLAIVDHGRVVVDGSPDQLKSELHGDTVQIELADETAISSAYAVLSALRGIGEITTEGAMLRARAGSGARAVPVVMTALDEARVEVSAVTVARPSLDDVYLRYAGHTFRAAA